VKSISAGKISSFTYILAFILFVIGLGFGYSGLRENPLDFTDFRSTMDSVSVFILNTRATDLMVLTLVFLLVGKIIDDISAKEPIRVRRNLILLAFLILLNLMLSAGARFWVEEYGLGDFLLWAIAGVLAFGMWVKIVNAIFMGDIKAMENTLKQFSDKEVYSLEGERLGKVDKVLFKGGVVSSIKVGSKLVKKDEVVSSGKVIVVKNPPKTTR
jgi:sporulation protein YlmC with PRC-barrel domain